MCIQRAHKIATEVLDGVTNHKKFIGILSTQASIALRQKKYQEALEIAAKYEAIANAIYGDNQLVEQYVCLMKHEIYCELKEKEFIDKDYLKKFGKIFDKICRTPDEAKEISCIWIVSWWDLIQATQNFKKRLIKIQFLVIKIWFLVIKNVILVISIIFLVIKKFPLKIQNQNKLIY